MTEIDRFIAVMKDATGKLRKEKSTRAGGKPKGRWFGWLRFQSGPAWMGALAAAALAVAVWIPRSPTVAYEAEVTVRAVRGADEGVAAVPRGKSFLLKADVAGIPAAEGYRLEIVDARGSEIWQASVPRTGTTVATLVPKKLRSGRYWVRIYGSSSALLREYALDSR